ncbi:MAG: tetratricopeptide repeat protein [Lyngbya sp.]|nr:tetratricopeptide repeat protein [Lyngbya sp.]
MSKQMNQSRKPRSIAAHQEGLKKLRDAKATFYEDGSRLTYEGIVEKVQIDRKTISKFFNGGRVDTDYALKITKFFGLEVVDIVGLEEWNRATSKLQYSNQATKKVNSPNLTTQVTLRQHNNSPICGAVEFVGRSEQLAELHQLLQEKNQIVEIAGMPGIGKTELAIQYSQSHAETYEGGICWLYPKRGAVEVQIVEFAITHFDNFIIPDGLTPGGQVDFCWNHWPAGLVLVVIDDVIDYRKVKSYLPRDSRFKILITARENLSKPLERLNLKLLKPRAAMNLLKSLIGRERLKQEPLIARKLCKWLEYLPLGLELVGHYLAQDEYLSLAEMLQRLERKRLRHPALKNPEPTMNPQLGVADALELSWERLDENTQKLGCFLSLFALAPIPWKLNELNTAIAQANKNVIKELLEEQGVESSESLSIAEELLQVLEDSVEASEEAKNKLVRFNLLQSNGEKMYRFHQLIREFFRGKLEGLPEADILKQTFRISIVETTKNLNPSLFKYREVEEVSCMIPHIEECLQEMIDHIKYSDLQPSLVFLTKFYEHKGLYQFAENWCRKLLNLLPKQNYDPLINIVIQKKLASLLIYQGRYSEAYNIYKYILSGLNNNSIDRDFMLIIVRNELAVLFICQGNIDKAEESLNECIKLLLKEFQNNTDDILCDDWQSYLVKLVDFFEKTYFLNSAKENDLVDIDTIKKIIIDVTGSLGRIYLEKCQYKEAELFLKKSLSFTTNWLGDEDLLVSVSQNNLAYLYELQGQFYKAISLYKKSLRIAKTFYGNQHPQVAFLLDNIANLYNQSRKFEKAETFFLESKTLREKFLGTKHPDYGATLNNLGLLYINIGRYQEAEFLLYQALSICEDLVTQGEKNYLCCADALNNLGLVNVYTNRIEEAKNLYLKSIEIIENNLRTENDKLASSYHNLAEVYLHMDKLDEAEKYYQKAYEIGLKVLGNDHHDTCLYKVSIENISFLRQFSPKQRKKIMTESTKYTRQHLYSRKSLEELNNFLMDLS